MQKYLREPFNGLTHYFAALIALVGFIILVVISRGDALKQVSMLVYGTSLVLMFLASASYHLVNSGESTTRFLRKLDHVAIYLLIAGTYTALAFNRFNGIYRWGLLIAIWSIAAIGIIIKFFIIKGPRWLSTIPYLVMGWLGVSALGEMWRALPLGALMWLLVGGLFFSIGAVIYATGRVKLIPGVIDAHEIWHIFVILGCASHYILILVYVAPLPRVI
jgi:hemolysin III